MIAEAGETRYAESGKQHCPGRETQAVCGAPGSIGAVRNPTSAAERCWPPRPVPCPERLRRRGPRLSDSIRKREWRTVKLAIKRLPRNSPNVCPAVTRHQAVEAIESKAGRNELISGWMNARAFRLSVSSAGAVIAWA